MCGTSTDASGHLIEVKPTSDMLLEKYMRQRQGFIFQRLGAANDDDHLN
jgi:hypothetical protein